jgi:Glyoxalase superfamily protein/Clp amino terminal domain, pathogenicity island component/Bacterial translation initiation factor IF-2 associated region
MRDFRDAKAMARTLRAALAIKGLKITVSQSLELIAEVFGVADWNTLVAAIRGESTVRRDDVSPSKPPRAETGPAQGVMFCRALEQTFHKALTYANQRNHEYATLEHLLLALTDDADALATMHACKVDLAVLKEHLTNYINNELKDLVTDGSKDAQPTAGFHRVVQRAVIHVQSSGREEVTGTEVLVAMFAERESPAVYFLQEQEMTQFDAVNYISHGIAKSLEQGGVRQSFSHGRTKPVAVEKIRRRRRPRDGQTAKDAK